MIKMIFLDLKKDREFELDFTGRPFEARKMYLRCKHSKKLRCIKVICETYSDYAFITGV